MVTSAPEQSVVTHKVSNGLSGALGALTLPVGDAVSVTVNGGVMPFTVQVGSSSQSKRSRTFAFMGLGLGTYDVLISDANESSFETKVVIS